MRLLASALIVLVGALVTFGIVREVATRMQSTAHILGPDIEVHATHTCGVVSALVQGTVTNVGNRTASAVDLIVTFHRVFGEGPPISLTADTFRNLKRGETRSFRVPVTLPLLIGSPAAFPWPHFTVGEGFDVSVTARVRPKHRR